MIHTHYVTMFFIMIASGILSTMNVWADKMDDIRFSLNDAYMILLMTGWMFFFMGILDKNLPAFLFGFVLVILNLWGIRTQFGVSQQQFILGMIPHHSMAVHMSRKLLENQNTQITEFARSIIQQQEKEIEYMKQLL